MSEYIDKCRCHIRSLEGGIAEATIIKNIEGNKYLADYNGVKCTAMFIPFAGRYYVDDKSGVIPESKYHSYGYLTETVKPPRFTVFNYQVSAPVFAVLIDRDFKTLTFYHKHYRGQIYNLRKPICVEVGAKMKQGLIRRTQGYYKNTQRELDGFIYYYFMTPEEQNKCKNIPRTPYDRKILETDDFPEAVRAICDRAYVYDRNDISDVNDRVSSLRYCEDFLKENPEPPTPGLKERNYEVR